WVSSDAGASRTAFPRGSVGTSFEAPTSLHEPNGFLPRHHLRGSSNEPSTLCTRGILRSSPTGLRACRRPCAARERDLLRRPPHTLGRRGLQDPRRIPRDGAAEPAQDDAAPQGAARLPLRARPGGLRPPISRALP